MTDDPREPEGTENVNDEETIAEEDLEAVTGGAGPDAFLNPQLGEAGSFGEAL